MVLDSYLQQIASDQVLLLKSLNIAFFRLGTLKAKLRKYNLLSYRSETTPETSLRLFSRAN